MNGTNYVKVKCIAQDERLIQCFDGDDKVAGEHCVHGITLRWHCDDCETHFENEKDKKQPILLLVPENLKDREFQIAFETHIEKPSECFMIDLDAMGAKPLPPKFEPPEGFKSMRSRIPLGPLLKVDPV